MSDLELSPVQKKKQKPPKYHQQPAEFQYLTEAQKLRYLQAKSEVERENILEEFQYKRDDEFLNNQILQHKHSAKIQKEYADDEFQLSSDQESDISKSEEEGEVRNDKSKKLKKQFEIEEPTVNVQKIEVEEKVDVYEKMIQDVTIKRNQIEHLLMNVFYNNVIEGAFVRIQEPQLKKYALAQILAVLEGDQQYQVGDIQTYKILKLQITELKEPKLRHISLVSNQKVETQEYILWKKSREDSGQALPNKETLAKKIKDLQKAFQIRLTDEQIEKKIISTIDEWSQQNKPQIYYKDLPYYESFISNQVNTERLKVESLEEKISEITFTQSETNEVHLEDTKKIIPFKRQQAQCKERIQSLLSYIKKIKILNEKYLNQQNKKTKQDISNLKVENQPQNNTKQEVLGKQNRNQENQDRIKQLDQQYITNLFQYVQTQEENNFIKETFFEKHNIDLAIDSMIDNFILEEI